MKRPLVLFAAVLAFGLIAAGCGDDDDDNGDDSAVTTETAPAETTDTTADTTVDTTAEDESAGDDTDVDAAVQDCKDSVDATGSQLSEDLKNDLKGLCDKAASGDEEEVRDASLEICEKIVEETVPDETARQSALDACKAAVE